VFRTYRRNVFGSISMSEAIMEPRSIATQAPAANETATEIEWITCRQCKNEIGVPHAMRERLIECPGCGLAVKPSETILFRPAARPPETPPPQLAPAAPLPSAPTTANQPAAPSVSLLQKADSVFN
jgi:hypothetical protein